MTEAELQKLVEDISLKYFGRPFIHTVKINRRMKTTGGRYHLDDHHIEINAHFLEAKIGNIFLASLNMNSPTTTSTSWA